MNTEKTLIKEWKIQDASLDYTLDEYIKVCNKELDYDDILDDYQQLIWNANYSFWISNLVWIWTIAFYHDKNWNIHSIWKFYFNYETVEELVEELNRLESLVPNINLWAKI